MIVIGHPLIGTADSDGQVILICIATKYIKLIPLPQLIHHIGNALNWAACFEGRVKPGDADEDACQK
jgi:hypothetical protein